MTGLPSGLSNSVNASDFACQIYINWLFTCVVCDRMSLERQLWDAAEEGQAAEVTRLLAAGAEVNWGDPGDM